MSVTDKQDLDDWKRQIEQRLDALERVAHAPQVVVHRAEFDAVVTELRTAIRKRGGSSVGAL